MNDFSKYKSGDSIKLQVRVRIEEENINNKEVLDKAKLDLEQYVLI